MNLPVEIIQKIMLYREIHPIAKILETYCTVFRRPSIMFNYELIIKDTPENRFSPSLKGMNFYNYLKYELYLIPQSCKYCHLKNKFIGHGNCRIENI